MRSRVARGSWIRNETWVLKRIMPDSALGCIPGSICKETLARPDVHDLVSQAFAIFALNSHLIWYLELREVADQRAIDSARTRLRIPRL